MSGPRSWCPGCEPNVDPLEEILDTIYCGAHGDTRDTGLDDQLITRDGYLAGSAEAGGEGNRLWCAFFSRKRKSFLEDP